MIDIHSHILPSVDDGAQSEIDSLEMARAAVKEGITTIIATPHHRNNVYENYKQDIETNVAILNELFEANDIPLSVLAGQEVRIYGEVAEDYKQGEIQTLGNSKYVLIEFPSSSVPQYTEQLFYDLQVAGLRPIIAHPERNRELLENPDRMYELIRMGALSQVTAASVCGKFGKKIAAYTHQLIEANLTHFIASDAHNTTTRSFHMKEAFELLRKMHGIDLYYSFFENSKLLVDNENVNRYEPERIKPKRKRRFGIF